MKILILRFSSIGDIVLTTPVVRCLKQQLPGAEIHYLTKSPFRSVLKNNPYIDKLHLLEKPLSKTIGSLKKENFDFVIDLHNNLRTRLIKLRLGVKSSSFNKMNFRKWLLVMKSPFQYRGSFTTVVTTSHSSPFGAAKRSKYSVSVV